MRTGCQWRLLPHDFPAWQTVYYDYTKWQREGTWDRLWATLDAAVRQQAGRQAQPSAAILDAQTVKTTVSAAAVAASAAGTGEKKIMGRKRHLLVDTLGLPIALSVLPANVPERVVAWDLLEWAKANLPRLQVVWVDQGYTGELETQAEAAIGCRVEVVRRPAVSAAAAAGGPGGTATMGGGTEFWVVESISSFEQRLRVLGGE